jgi:hypothetical protein
MIVLSFASVMGIVFDPAIFAVHLALFIKENKLLTYVISSAAEHMD